MLDKTYRPELVETKHYEKWERDGAFECGKNADEDPYASVITPPNVTGSLHMGHALNNTLQDILIRCMRMRGRDTLWQPGMDHAGIATQMVVERQLEANGQTRADLGRDAFLKKVWEWKAESGGAIIGQLRRLGASCDWSRERFTMDEGLNKAVRKVFVQLYKEKLAYKDNRLVNWDPKLQTAISDLEVQQQEVNGSLWYFKYPVEGFENKTIIVATTRPETLLGDTAVAVHPDDERYRDLIGKFCILPLVGRRIPIVADEYADPEQGSGAVKITPAHDFNDFEVGRRHNLGLINIFNVDATVNDAAPEAYRGMDRYEARQRIIADIDAAGLLDRIEDHVHMVPYGDRGGVPIEPYLTEQWYVDAATLAKPAIEAVEQGRMKFVPENWSKTYFEWMRNIEPWCVSRQLRWGHQIPAWYGPDEDIFVEETETAAQSAADAHYGQAVPLRRDEDVLDTWFSSGLWAFSTLGWPEKTPELARYYPTDVLVTGFDIIFFWVARMMMLGLHFMGDVPFHTVYVHALVRDENGQKMSKSKGNVIDPLELVDEYGGDALRFTLASLAAPGRDIKLSGERVAGSRNFVTKLWNAARYCEMNDCSPQDIFDPAECQHTLNRWIVSELVRCVGAVNTGLDSYRFNDAAQALYQFTWRTYCDWYLEFSKPLLMGDDVAFATETRATAAWVLDQTLHLLHPFMPFVTEELWEQIGDQRPQALVTSPWPDFGGTLVNCAAEDEMGWVVELISSIRSVRSEMNVPPAARISMVISGAGDVSKGWAQTHEELIHRLARVGDIAFDVSSSKGAVQLVHRDATVMLHIADVLDLDQESARLQKAVAKSDVEIMKFQKKLGNQNFLSRAPENVIQEQKNRLADEQATKEKLNNALTRLSDLS
jgi:valyl-tRNA synthetase